MTAVADSTLHTGCPVDHSKLSEQRTSRETLAGRPAIEQRANGEWHIYGYAEAKTVLRSAHTRQAGFHAEEMEKLPRTMRDPILFQEGQSHREQRTKTARFFTPVRTDEAYRGFMEAFADDIIAKLERGRAADLSDLSMTLAVEVAAQVVGLTNSRIGGMSERVERFFAEPVSLDSSAGKALHFALNQLRIGKFFFADVQPAIAARRRQPREDLISHLISEGYTNAEILVECMTFAAAGMITTREFISVCAWHLLDNPELRAQYLSAPEPERYKLLHELLRLEPVVGHLHRTATADIDIVSDAQTYTVPEGAHIVLHIYGTNTDERVVGEAPERACPARALPKGVGDPVMSFGDGHHRCPGAYIAIQETDIFLQKLLSLNVRVKRAPDLSWNELVKGYELRKFMLELQ